MRYARSQAAVGCDTLHWFCAYAALMRSNWGREGRTSVRACAGALILVTAGCGSAARLDVNRSPQPSRTDAATTTVTTAPYPLGPADSPYWIIADPPSGARVAAARTVISPGQLDLWRVEYAVGHRDSMLHLEVVLDSTQSLDECLSRGTAGDVRGHRSCETTLFDDGREFGWKSVWDEQPNLRITVSSGGSPGASSDARAIVREAVRNVQPIPKATAENLVLAMDMPTSTPTQRVEVARGTVDGAVWILTALEYTDFPLVPDDHRAPCVELSYRGEVALACGAYLRPESGWARIGGKVFAFGAATSNVQAVRLMQQEAPREFIANVDTLTAGAMQTRYFAVVLPDDDCGVEIFDAASGDSVGAAAVPAGAERERCIRSSGPTTTMPGAINTVPFVPVPSPATTAG